MRIEVAPAIEGRIPPCAAAGRQDNSSNTINPHFSLMPPESPSFVEFYWCRIYCQGSMGDVSETVSKFWGNRVHVKNDLF